MLIKQIDSDAEKGNIARTILEALPDWFGIPQAREEYIAGSRGKPFFCAFDAERPVGFLYLKETGRHTVEVGGHGRGQGMPPSGHWPEPLGAGKGKSRADGIFFHPGQNRPDGPIRYLR